MYNAGGVGSVNCLKCGRAAKEGQVFCPDCQEKMAKHPVKPGAVIHLTHREVPLPDKKSAAKSREATPQDQLLQLRKMIRWLAATITLLSLLLCVAAGMLIHTLTEESAVPAIGRNYTTAQTPKP